MFRMKLSDILLLVAISCLIFILAVELVASIPSQPRTIKDIENVRLLWAKEVDIDDPHGILPYFFIPDEQSVVFETPNTLQSLNINNGETLWEVKMSGPISVSLYEDTFFIQLFGEKLEEALIKGERPKPCAFFEGDPSETSLSAYNAHTGERLWGYRYHSVSGRASFDENYVYLTGTDNHGANSSVATIEINSGTWVGLRCNDRPPTKKVSPPATSEIGYVNPGYLIYDESELDSDCLTDRPFFMVIEGNTEASTLDIIAEKADRMFSYIAYEWGSRLNILAKGSKEPIGYIEFSGRNLCTRQKIERVNFTINEFECMM
jgi:hypothetical protein